MILGRRAFTLDGEWHYLIGAYVPGDYRLYLDEQLVRRRTNMSGFRRRWASAYDRFPLYATSSTD